ncbi:hypothetical protein C0J52_06431 [Blattella germanica]|nr:hypothetical protein C0J52_06431 [Blattella germanica]
MIKRVGYKGSKVGVEQEGYRLPQGSLERDGHDWYCFECHAGGDLRETQEKDDKLKLKRRQLNHLLGFTCARLKERLPATITDRQVPSKNSYISDRAGAMTQLAQRRASSGSIPSDSPVGLKWVTDDGDLWRVDYLIYRPMDLRTMEGKAANGKYHSLHEFQADAEIIVHNVVIYHGVHSTLADMSRQMLRDCTYDLQEIRQCRDCYRVSNEKLDKHWFCQPCRPNHQLVYAKQKGFPYWPAKVIKIQGDQYDVRFFGGHHQRAVIEKSHIRPISVNIHTLQVKRTSTWNKACEELKRHQDLLDKLTLQSESSSDDDDDDEDDVEVTPIVQRRPVGRPRKGSTPVRKSIERKPAKVVKVETEEEDDDEDDDDDLETMEVDGAESDGEVSPEEEEEASISSTSKPTTDVKKEGVSQEDMCYNCECEAIYHCCWNTAYCSIDCQQLHWQKEHKRVCRRKR